MTDQDPRAWRVAIALGLESGLDWARWASGANDLVERKAQAYADEVRRCHAVGFSNDLADSYADVAADEVDDPTPVPAPWDADAYLADCARRGVEPGPLPSLEWSDLEDSGIEWSVMMEDFDQDDGTAVSDVVIGIGAGNAEATYSLENGWALNGQRIIVDHFDVLLRLATAAAKAMVGP